MAISFDNGRTMIITNIILLLLFSVSNTWSHGQVDIESNDLNEGDYGILKKIKFNPGDSEKVSVKVYYECHCPGCIAFDVRELGPVVETMDSYLDIKTYPFGNGRVIDDNGSVKFRCQHGPAECYGNKLHACALDKLNHTTALLYNICLMNSRNSRGSDDESADRCAQSMKIDSEKIKACAKGTRGIELLKFYAEETKKANLPYVPYVLINGKLYNSDDFKRDVCAAFANPPPPCKNE